MKERIHKVLRIDPMALKRIGEITAQRYVSTSRKHADTARHLISLGMNKVGRVKVSEKYSSLTKDCTALNTHIDPHILKLATDISDDLSSTGGRFTATSVLRMALYIGIEQYEKT